METTKLEYWTFDYLNGKTVYKIYTEDREIRNLILAMEGVKQGAVYSKGMGGQVIGYDLLVPKSKMEFIRKKFNPKYLS